MAELAGVGWDFAGEHPANGLLLCDERTATHPLFAAIPWVLDAHPGVGHERGHQVGHRNQRPQQPARKE